MIPLIRFRPMIQRQRLTTVLDFRSPLPGLTTRPPSPSGSAHDVLDDDQTASQEPRAEEYEIATCHVRLKTRHPEPSTGMNSGPPLDLSDTDAKSSPGPDSSLTDITSQPPSSLSSFRLHTGEPEPVLNVIGTPVLPSHPPTPAPISRCDTKNKRSATPVLFNVNEEPSCLLSPTPTEGLLPCLYENGTCVRCGP